MFELYANDQLITRRKEYEDCLKAAVRLRMARFFSPTERILLKPGVEIRAEVRGTVQ
jgi:hypothetical protein